MSDYSLHQFGQKDFIPQASTEKPVHLIGAGGIGSPTAMVLSKMGFHDLYVYDDDQIEPHNVGAQLYHTNQDGMHKVEALKQFVESFTSVGAHFPGPGQELSPFSVVVSAVDSMAARQEIWDYLKTQKMVSLYVDARMGLESIRVYALDPSDKDSVRRYEQNLYPDSEGEGLACSAKSVAYNGFFAAAVIGGLISAYSRRAHYPLETIGDMAEFGLQPTM